MRVALLLSVTAVGATDSTLGTREVQKEELNFRRLANSTASDAHTTAFLSSAAALTVIASSVGRRSICPESCAVPTRIEQKAQELPSLARICPPNLIRWGLCQTHDLHEQNASS